MPAAWESPPGDGAWTASMMSREVDRLRVRISHRLREAGVRLPDAELRDVSEAIISDAVRLSLHWLDIERETAH